MRYPLSLVLCSLLALVFAPPTNANIVFQVADLGAGNTQWQLVSSDTTYVVGQNNPTGFLFDQIILPKSAFQFDYSQSFSLTLSSPIGSIRNITSGQTVSLNLVTYYKNLDLLQLGGGPLNFSLGDHLQITDFSLADIAIPFSTLTGNSLNSGYAYFTPGAWHNESVVEINPVLAPEPSSFALFGLALVVLLLSRKSRPAIA